MTNTIKGISLGLLAATTLAFAGCGGSAPEEPTTGFLSLAVSDGPIHEALKVCVKFDEIELMKSGTSTVIQVGPQTIDLLAFQGTDSVLIVPDTQVDAGRYQWLRLGIDAVEGESGGAGDTNGSDCDGTGSYIIMKDGTMHNLYIPSYAETGLKFVSGFTVQPGGLLELTAEFDLAKSLTQPPGLDPDVVLRPVIRLVDNSEDGTLTGTVTTELATSYSFVTEELCAPSVYVFPPNSIVKGFADGIEPIATAMVTEQANNDGTFTWSYTIGFLLPGAYQAGFTCEGIFFFPMEGVAIEILEGQVTTADF